MHTFVQMANRLFVEDISSTYIFACIHLFRWQIDYLSSTSEVAHAKSILEEERRLFGVETERMMMDLDLVRANEGRLLSDLEVGTRVFYE